MINFLICSHITENKKEQSHFLQLKEQLERLTGEKVNLILPENYLHELEIAKSQDIDLYFASPINAYRFYQKGYIPVCKKNRHTFVLIGSKKEDNITVSLPYYENFFVVLLFIKELDLLRPKVIYAINEEEAYKSVLEGKANLAILYKGNYLQLKEKYESLPVIKEIQSQMYHFLMVKPSVYEIYKDVWQELECSFVDKNEFLENLKLSFSAGDLLKVKTFFDIAKSVYENEYIGTVIYKDKIVYASETVEKLLGYSSKELKNFSPLKLFGEDIDTREIVETIKRRLRGEQFIKTYPFLKFRAKNGSLRYVKGFTKTIIFENEYAGLGIFIDITKEVRYQKVFNLLRKINKVITTVLTEDELFTAICKTLVEEFDIKFTWIGLVNPHTKKIEKLYSCGKNQQYLNKRGIKIGIDLTKEKSVPSKALTSDSIVINPDTDKCESIDENIKILMKNEKLLSSASIPIEKEGKVVALLNIYASEPNFFENEVKDLLEELKRDINFALEKIETLKNGLLLKSAIEKSDEWVLITDEKGRILYVNKYVSKISGYKPEELVGKTPKIFKSGYQPKEFYEHLWKTILSGKEFEAIFVNRKKNGELFYLEEKIIPVKLPDGSYRFVALGRDITQEITLSQENERLRYFDILTNLYNYNGFRVKVEDFINTFRNSICALVIFDISNFSYINKTYGIDTGDKILREVANILKYSFRKEDIVARVGGDEFGIFFVNLKHKGDAIILEYKLKDLFEKEIQVNGNKIRVFINGGISIYSDDGKDFYTLYENASIALKEAKKEGANVIKFFNRDLESKVSKFIYAGELVEKAVRKNLFIFHYQPYFHAENLSVAGLEALVRIKDEDGRVYYPKDFIDYLENSVHLREFEKWSLHEIAKHIEKWNLPISVNISAKTFKSEEFEQDVFRYSLNLPSPLVIEITERLYMKDVEKSLNIINEIKKCKNIKVAIDDFGTGYSSLSYLKDINADILKIDISFVRAMVNDKKSQAVVETIIHLAKALEMKTLAEGVETTVQLELLKNMGVDYVQGFLLSKPLPEEELEKKYFKI